MSTSSGELIFFPPSAEKYLTHIPPSYAVERRQIFIRIASTVILFIFMVPKVLTEYLQKRFDKKNRMNAATKPVDTPDDKVKNKNDDNKKKTKKKNKTITTSNNPNQVTAVNHSSDCADHESIRVSLPWYLFALLNICALYGVTLLLLLTSNNRYVARGIFQGPLLLKNECQELIAMFESTAPDHGTLYLQNITEREQNHLIRLLDARLAPVIERVYGVVPRAIHADEISIFSNEHNRHIDVTSTSTKMPHIYFSVFLNDNFHGGAMNFTNRRVQQSVDLRPDVGSVLIFDSTIEHGLMNVTDGKAYVMTGSLKVKIQDERKSQHTGVSHCATLLSLSWLRVWLRNAADEKHILTKPLLVTFGSFLEWFTDLWAPHFHVKLVDHSIGGDEEGFLHELDKSTVFAGRHQKAKWLQQDALWVHDSRVLVREEYASESEF